MKRLFLHFVVVSVFLVQPYHASGFEKGWSRWSYDLEETHFYPLSSASPVSLNDFEKKWTAPIAPSYHALTGDINGDGFLEVVCNINDVGTCYAFDHTGNQLWQTPFTGRLQLLADVTGDGILEILLDKRIGSQGHILILDGAGNLIKTILVPVGYDGHCWPRAAGDFDNDGQIEIVAVLGAAYSANPRGAYMIDYSSGAIEWYYAAGPSGKLQGGDVDEDGKVEFVYGGGSVHNGGYGCGVNNGASCTGDNAIWTICFNAEDGSELFTRNYFADGQYRGSTEHIIADPNRDGDRDIFSFEGHSYWYPGTLQIHQIDHFGNVIRTWNGEYVSGTDAHSPCVAIGDINNDGFDEIVFAFYNMGNLRILDHQFNLLASRPINANALPCCSYPDIFINDINGDGQNEILFGDWSLEQVRIFDQELNDLWSFSAGFDPRITISDLDNDGINEILVAGDSLYVVGVPTAPSTSSVICGTVTEPGGLQSIAHAVIELFDQENQRVPIDPENSDGDNDEFTLQTDNEGKYTIRNLFAGTYELKCWADRNGYTGKDSVEGIQLQPGEIKDGIDVRIPKVIPVPYYEQGKTDWCAIASLSMILSYNKVLVKPWQVACYFNKPPEIGMRPGADLPLMEQYVETFGLSCESRYPLWESFDVIRENIIGYLNQHIPMLFGSDKIKHAFVIAGYDDYSFYVHDPSEKISADILSTPLISPVAVRVPFDIFESRIWGYTIGEFSGYLVIDPGSTSHSNGPSAYTHETSGPWGEDNFYYSNHLAFKDSEQPFQGNHIVLSLDGTAQPYGYCYRDFTRLHPLSPPETGLLRAATTNDILRFAFVVANPFAHPVAISCYATITEDGLTQPVHFFLQQEMNLPAYSPETPYANVFSVSELTPGKMYTLAAHLTTTEGDAVDICFFNFYVLQYSDDFDNDGLSNDVEITTGTDPYDDDTDDDGLLDGPGSGEDLNANGVVDAGETDPRNPDTDGDGILDGTEKGLSSPEGDGTDLNVFVPDSDPSTTTDPTNADTDGDGIPDGQEDINKNGRVDPGELSPNIFDFACDIDIDPNTLNLGSGGKWVTCYIELPHQYDPHGIDVSTIKLNDSVHAETTPASIGNYDADSILDLMVKFNRSAVGSILGPGDSVQIMVRGQIQGKMFFGFDTIRVIGTPNPRVIAGGSVNIPEKFSLVQNYPNPFNPQTTIEFHISKPCNVMLEIFNMLGQKVAELVNEHKDSGYYAVVWDGKDDNGSDVANGIYFYRIKAGEFSDVKKMVLLR